MDIETQAAVATANAQLAIRDLFSFSEDVGQVGEEELEVASATGSQLEVVQEAVEVASAPVEVRASTDAEALAEDVSQQPCDVEVSQPSEEPGFTAYWKDYLSAVLRAEKEIDELVDASEGRMKLRGLRNGERLNGYSLLRQTRKEIKEQVYFRAEREFAPQSGSLSIPRHEHEELLGENWDHCDDASFDPDALWKALEGKYGGNYGVELGYKQLAAKLVSGFGLRRNKPVRKANRLELTDTIYCEKQYNGTMELSYSSAESVSQLHHAMSAFCEWAGDYETARKLNLRSRDMMMNRNRAVVSRARFDMGGVGYVMFYKNMTWEIYGDLGDQFQAFIGKYGREALASNY